MNTANKIPLDVFAAVVAVVAEDLKRRGIVVPTRPGVTVGAIAPNATGNVYFPNEGCERGCRNIDDETIPAGTSCRCLEIAGSWMARRA